MTDPAQRSPEAAAATPSIAPPARPPAPAEHVEDLGVLARLRAHPTGFWFVFWGELAERASFYGMRTILALYLLEVLRFEKATSASINQFFMASCYVAPLFGGWLADRYLGRYRTILYFSIPYIAGHLILGGFATRPALFIALVLLAFGSGAIKPNTSTLMGQIYEHEGKSALLTEAFSYFYAAINIGAAASSLSLPLVRNRFGYGVALTIPAALMVAAFLAFAAGRRYYPREQVRARPPKTPEQRRAERETLLRIGGVFLLIAVFWFVYDQSASTWIYFAKDHVDLTLFPGVSISPDQIQGLNPVLIVALTPVFNWLWGAIRRRRGGADLPDTRKMLLGFLIVVGCMTLMAAAGFAAREARVNVWWVLLATFVITLAELCVSVVGLEFAYRQAAPGTKSVVTAAFLFTVFLGNMAGGFFDRLYEHPLVPGPYFAVQAGILVVTAATFALVARRFERNGGAGATERAG